jgi:TolB-like protein
MLPIDMIGRHVLECLGAEIALARAQFELHLQGPSGRYQGSRAQAWVRYVAEGSVRKASGKVRIAGQLIDAVTGTHIWADRFERDLTDVFALCAC